MKKIFVILVLIVLSCNTADDISPTPTTGFENQVVSSDFNWISGSESTINVEVLAPAGLNINLEKQQIWVRNQNEEKIAFAILDENNRGQFQLVLPQGNDNYDFYLPTTQESWPVEGIGNQSLQLQDPFEQISTSSRPQKKTIVKTKSIQNNLLGNGDFETPILPANIGYSDHFSTSPVNDGQWRTVNNEFSQTSVNGSTAVVPGNTQNIFWQNISVNPGDTVNFDADYSGEVYFYLWFWDSNLNLLGYTYGPLSFFPNGLEDVAPNNSSMVTALFYFVSYDAPAGDYVDNTFLEITSNFSDADNDGVSDDEDEYPNDPTIAYTSYWPSNGNATIMYEDLWPSKGDYDFNDMVIDVHVTMYHNAQGDWVSADYEVALNAVGAGIDNALAVRYVNTARNPIPNMVTSVTGDAKIDPDVDNGIIIFDRPSDLQSSYYTNTSPNLTATPDVATFTVNFDGSYNSPYILDFYIFRSDNRGHEIHVPGFSGTNMADANLYNTGDDINGTYRTAQGLPWALGVIWNQGTIQIPLEGVDFLNAYPNYGLYISSDASTNTDWYKFPNTNNTLDISSF